MDTFPEMTAVGTRTWRTLDGELHREDGPAVEDADGGREWWQHGLLHRLDGPAYERSGSPGEWHVRGQLHRVDGPARQTFIGDLEWFQNGQLHRTDGPARECANGQREWYIHNKRLPAKAVAQLEGLDPKVLTAVLTLYAPGAGDSIPKLIAAVTSAHT
jgi:hypothetical protein